jgi:hypothetical protein
MSAVLVHLLRTIEYTLLTIIVQPVVLTVFVVVLAEFMALASMVSVSVNMVLETDQVV